MNLLLIICLMLSVGCVPIPAAVRPPAPVEHIQSFAQVILPAPNLIILPVPPALVGQPSDYFIATDITGPWVYFTDNFYCVTNDDGSSTGAFSNDFRADDKFLMIVPLNGPYPLPRNLVTNQF